MQAADDVELRDGLAVALAGLGDALLDRHVVAAGLVDLLGPRAERAVHPAEVRRVQVAVDVVEREVAVARLADVVGEAAEGEQVARLEEPDAVVEGEPLPGENLVGDRRQVGALEGGGELRHGIAGLVTGWKGSWDTGATSSTKGVRYR